MLKRAIRSVQEHGTVVAYLILMAFAAFSLSLAFVAIGRVQSESNKTRCQIVALVETFTENSQRAAKATISSPTASKAQKDAATLNLSQTRAALRTTQEKLGNPTGEACTIAP